MCLRAQKEGTRAGRKRVPLLVVERKLLRDCLIPDRNANAQTLWGKLRLSFLVHGEKAETVLTAMIRLGIVSIARVSN